MPMDKTRYCTGNLVKDDDGGACSKFAITTIDPFSSNLEECITQMRKTSTKDNTEVLCNRLSATAAKFQKKEDGKKVVAPAVKTIIYDCTELDVTFSGEYFNNGAPGGILKKMVVPVPTVVTVAGKKFTDMKAFIVWRLYSEETAEAADLAEAQKADDEDDDMNQVLARLGMI